MSVQVLSMLWCAERYHTMWCIAWILHCTAPVVQDCKTSMPHVDTSFFVGLWVDCCQGVLPLSCNYCGATVQQNCWQSHSVVAATVQFTCHSAAHLQPAVTSNFAVAG